MDSQVLIILCITPFLGIVALTVMKLEMPFTAAMDIELLCLENV